MLHGVTSRNALPNLNVMMNQLPAPQAAAGAASDGGVTKYPRKVVSLRGIHALRS